MRDCIGKVVPTTGYGVEKSDTLNSDPSILFYSDDYMDLFHKYVVRK